MIIEKCRIDANIEIARNIWKMNFRAPEIASRYIGPGQFVEILGDSGWSHPLRRPMSIAKVVNSKVTIIYKLFGPVTRIFSEKKPGENLNILGPLGNGFTDWNNKTHPILVGGGIGLAPILNLHDLCNQQGIQTTLIIGAKTAAEHFMDHDPSVKIYLTTDDGSIGNRGTVIPTLANLISGVRNPKIFACGPELMLMAVQNYAIINKIPAQLAVESYMGCGVGICQGCAIEKTTFDGKVHSYHERYSLVCLDGPVYNADEVVFG